MKLGTGTIRCASAVALSLAAAFGGVTAASASPKPGSLAFSTGSWKITFDAEILQNASFVNSTIDVHGEGDANVENGQLTATCQAGGSTYGTVTTAGQSYDVNGALTVSNCAFNGPASAPVWSAVTGFAGTVNGAGAGGTFGPISSPLTLLRATPNLVEGHWEDSLRAATQALGVDVTGPAAFIAVKNGDCPTSGPLLPNNDKNGGRIQNGTPASPTMVRLDVDPSISGDAALEQGLEAAIVTWNADLEQAGRNIVFTTESGPGPVVHIAVDSPATESQLGAQPIGGNSAAETDTVQSTPGPNGVRYTQVANTLVKSGGISASEPWSSVNPDIVEHLFLHELGHVLGLGDEHTTPDSVMWSKLLTSTNPTTVSCQDLRTLKSL
jgi:hypothetical protein